MIRTTDSLASLASQSPAAARVFRRHQLDYYCRGDRPLASACQAASLDPTWVAAEIEAEGRGSTAVEDWVTRSVAELVRQILARYHEPLHPEILRLQELARSVENVHAAKPDCPRGLVGHLESMGYSLEEHLAREEEIVFPLLVHGQFERAAPAIRAMRAEHDQHAQALRRTRVLTRDFRMPAEACETWRALSSGLEELERDLMDHMHVENYVLFPRALELVGR